MAYEMRECVLEGVPPPNSHMAAYSPDGGYIGLEDWAQNLEDRGIQPQLLRPDFKVCSIGFCEREQKWYGWSHRAIYGFGVGSEVKRGDCAYNPTDEADFREDCLRFWVSTDEHKTNGLVFDHERDGVRGALVTWTFNDLVPNEKLRGVEDSHFTPYPESYGRGEWTAQTLDDAKQMACDFAEGVS